ncbi:MAG: right-handed parallel beta-helix repeat-containing protein, partial [Lachnospiraceae bacterium]|nr:right-handed parallel beta-helix repeat-containing protein [Lachnospiraceae bacterium]
MRKSIKRVFAAVLTAAVIVQGVPSFIDSAKVNAAFAQQYSIPGANANGRVGATVPYTRYDSASARIGGGAAMATGYNMDRYNIASQASERSYVRLPQNGSYAEWTVNQIANGVTMRFTMPDSSDGYGMNGSLDVYVNGTFKKRIDLTSYYMWQYFSGGNPNDSNDGGPGAFAFDEVHFMLDRLKPGDTIKIQSSGAGGIEYGVDFLEIEEVPDKISQPSGSLNVMDFGAIPDDGNDDYNAIVNCINTASGQGKTVYFPAGTFRINQIWSLNASNITITGAGMWYTNIKFTNSNASSGGISCNCNNVEFCNMYLNSSLRSRYNQNAVYKCFMDVLGGGSVVHDVWEDHFECGFWMADYTGRNRYSDGLVIKDCRIRNNLADGVNFCQGTSNATVYNCSIRNNGDDGLAMWNNSYLGVKDESDNVFAYNTIDFIWRAGGIAIYGGNNHKIYNNYICDSFMSSGIHLNTTFDGYKFNNTTNIDFSNNVMVRCGAGKGSWGEEFGAIDIDGNVKNITFNNNRMYDSEHDAVRLLGSLSNIKFNDTVIYGTGVDGQQYNYSSIPHIGVAILAINGASATFNNVSMSKIAYGQVNYINGGNVSLNNVNNRGNAGYDVP